MDVVTSNRCVLSLSPRLEGANIQTWVGFKHLIYLAEESVLGWFRRLGYGPQRLFHAHGVALEFVDTSVLLPSLVEIDDTVVAETTMVDPGRFTVRMAVDRGAGRQTVLSGKLAVRLRHEPDPPGRDPLPHTLRPLIVSDNGLGDGDGERADVRCPNPAADPAVVLSPASRDAFYWPWQARYFHCQYSRHVQQSAYVRALEEVVDRFLDNRELGIGRMLDERALIPVVSRARIHVLAPAFMDETIHTTFRVTEILKARAFDGCMDCYVERGATFVHVATAGILHGYAVSAGAAAGQLATLDDGIVAALQRRQS